MKQIALILTLLLWPAIVHAQERVVLSGEHGAFTRLSVPIPEDARWRLRKGEGAYSLVVDGGYNYDLDDVFRRIARERIAGISQSETELRIDLGCDCEASAFVFRDRYVVVDIKEAPPTERANIQKLSAPMLPADNDRDLRLPLVIGMEGPTVSSGLSFAAESVAASTGDVDLREIQLQLSDALREVAGTDLLVNQDTAELASAPLAKEPASLPEVPRPARSMTTLPGLNFRSGSDLRATEPSGSEDAVCWPADYTDIAGWAPEGTSLATELGQRRAALTDTAGASDPVAVLALARTYVFFGFGAEAISALDLDDSDSRARQALRAVAEITDDVGSGHALLSQTGCPGPVGLWHYLAQPDPSQPSSDIVLNFKNLPIGLRLALAGRLAVRLMTDGYAEEAEQVLRTLAEDDASARDRDHIDLQVSMASDSGLLTLDQIEDRLDADTPLPPEILVTLADRTLEAGLKPPTALVAQLEDQIFIARGTPMVSALRASLIRADIANENFVRAFERARPTVDPSPDPMTDLRSEVVEAAARIADTATVIEIAFQPEAGSTSPTAQNALARRLLDLGFPDEARALLDGPATGGAMGERRYLRAEAEVAMGEQQRASETLAGITTPRAEAILSGSDWSILRADDTARAAAAWRTSDWTALVESEDPTLQDLATLATRDAPRPASSALLTSGRQIADEAAAARAILEQGLNRFTSPAE